MTQDNFKKYADFILTNGLIVATLKSIDLDKLKHASTCIFSVALTSIIYFENFTCSYNNLSTLIGLTDDEIGEGIKELVDNNLILLSFGKSEDSITISIPKKIIEEIKKETDRINKAVQKFLTEGE